MKKLLITMILVYITWLSYHNIAYAGTIVTTFSGSPFTLTTNANQDAKLDRLLTKENERRANQNPPATALTMEQYISQIIVATLGGYSQQSDATEKQDFCTVFVTLPQNQKNQIIAAGGGNSPCP